MDAARYHEHYLLQASWLGPARRILFRRAGLAGRERVLDLGCGSGVIAEEMRLLRGGPVLAVDRDRELLAFARRRYPGNEYLEGDERLLLKRGRRFDLIVLSFVLMWQARPLAFLKRARRLLDAGGVLLLLAEPDYGGRLDHPPGLDILKEIYAGHVRREGGNPDIGRRLGPLLDRAGFAADIELAGCLHRPRGPLGPEWEREWRFWQELAGLDEAERARLMAVEKKAVARGERLVLFPVFCALARPRP